MTAPPGPAGAGWAGTAGTAGTAGPAQPAELAGAPGSAPPRERDGLARRGTLATRVALVTTAVAAVAVLIAGLVSLGLVRSAGDADARRTLSALADAAAEGAERTGPLGRAGAGRQRARAQLTGLQIDFTFLTRDGRTNAGPQDGLAARALTPGERAAVVGGEPLSLTRDLDGTRVLVEARPTAGGGLILAQPLSEASVARRAVGRIGLAMLIGLGVAVAAGIVLARLLARPLRRAADAARAMAGGARDVQVRRRRDRPRSPRSRTPSTRCRRRWRPARAGSGTSCCPSRTSCAPRSPRSPASPSRSPTASPPATTCGRSGGPCSARPGGWTGW